jgi:hypothetical protein
MTKTKTKETGLTEKTQTVALPQIEYDWLIRFKNEVWEQSNKIDPDDEYVWFDLSLGFFLGAGANLKTARKLSNLAIEANWTPV